MKKYLNVFLRILTLSSKFLLVFFLAKYISEEDFGLYGLISTTVVYSLYFIGLDFYYYSTREMLKVDMEEWWFFISNQFFLSFVVFVFFIPLSFFLFFYDFLPDRLMLLFYSLVVFEYLGQELGRILVVAEKQLVASILMFIRMGLWGIVLVPLIFFSKTTRNVETILMIWSLGSFLSVVLGSYVLFLSGVHPRKIKINRKWIQNGLRVSLPLLVGTLALRGIYTVDKYGMDYLVGLDAVAAYVLFMGICNALTSILDAGIFVYSYPELVKNHQNKEFECYKKNLSMMAKKTILVASVFSIFSLIFIDDLLNWLGNSFYKENIRIFYIILPAIFLYSLSMIPHFGLYAKGVDFPNYLGQILAFVIFLFFSFSIKLEDKMLIVPISLCCSFLFLFVWKSLSLIKYWDKK